MNRNVYLLLLGGLGDCFRAINNPNNIQAYFKKYIEETEDNFKIIAGCHGPIKDLFRYIECDHLYSTDMEEIQELCGDWEHFPDVWGDVFGDKPIEFYKPDFVPYDPILNEQENECLNEIKSKGPYFVIHPFTSSVPKTPLANWKWVCKHLKKQGYNSVILGQSYKIWNKSFKNEGINIKGKHIINKVNECSLPLSYSIVTNAEGFVGCDSCWFNLALYRLPFLFLILTPSFTYKDLPLFIKQEPLTFYTEVTECNHHLEILYEMEDDLKTFVFNITNAHVKSKLKEKLKLWQQIRKSCSL